MPRSLSYLYFYLYFPMSIWDSHWEKRSKRGIEASVGIVRTLSTSNIVQTWQVADMSLLGLSLGKTTRIVNCLRFVFLDVHTAAAVKHYWKAQRQCAAENTCMAHATLTVALNTEYLQRQMQISPNFVRGLHEPSNTTVTNPSLIFQFHTCSQFIKQKCLSACFDGTSSTVNMLNSTQDEILTTKFIFLIWTPTGSLN